MKFVLTYFLHGVIIVEICEEMISIDKLAIEIDALAVVPLTHSRGPWGEYRQR